MTYPLVRDLAVDGIPVTVTCRVLGFSTQGFYRWLAEPVCDRDWDDAHLINAIIDIHHDDPEFGYRFIADELERAGQVASENRVQRLCALQKVISTTVKRRRRGCGKTPGPAVHDDLVNRDFTADELDQVWLTDISEHPTGEGKLYICAVKDVCSRRIVGYAIDDRMTSRLADAALRTAIARRNPTGTTVVHSDRGGQFRSRRYQRTLRAHGLVGSMGRVASAADNAAMESFFSLLQANVLDRHAWATREELRIAIITWIERTYHRRRRQRALGKLTPVEFEAIIGYNTMTAAA
jgi:transposase InsO family protein